MPKSTTLASICLQKWNVCTLSTSYQWKLLRPSSATVILRICHNIFTMIQHHHYIHDHNAQYNHSQHVHEHQHTSHYNHHLIFFAYLLQDDEEDEEDEDDPPSP